MGKMRITYRAPGATGQDACDQATSDAEVTAGQAAPAQPDPRPLKPREVLHAAAAKARALLRLYLHSRKVRAAANALSAALAESREVSSWPGDRLPVGAAMSDRVERLTRRLKLETAAHNRLEVLFKSVEMGRSAAAV